MAKLVELQKHSLRSRFKRAAVVTALAVNAVTLVNAFILGDRFMLRDDYPMSAPSALLFAPLITAENWMHGNDPDYDWGGPTPIGRLGNIAHKASPVVDGTLDAVFTIAGIPGAYAGYLGGVIVGAFTPANPKQSPAPSAPE